MKKILAFLLALCMIMPLCTQSVIYAADDLQYTKSTQAYTVAGESYYRATLTKAIMSSANAERGDEVVLTITLSNAPKTQYAVFRLTLPEGITFVSGEWFTHGNIDTARNIGVWMALGATDLNGEVVTLTFSVEDTATCGENEIEFDFWVDDSAERDANVTEVVGVINVHSCSDAWANDDSEHWHECTVCGDKTAVAEHSFDNACDATCNVCADEREVPDHVYNNACDATCNVCDAEREVSDHVYDNACDTNCNVCADEREITHDFEWVVDEEENCGVDGKKHEECTVCRTTRNENTAIPATGDHTYDNACDSICNVCKQEREVPDHVYDNACDTTCNVCGDVRAITHDFEWVVDEEENCGVDGKKHEECAVCYTTRNENTTIPATGNHTYDNACDSICNVCEQEREVPDHVYDNACDTTCNSCEYVRVTTHDYSDELKNDDESHWYECTVCEKKMLEAVHSYSGNWTSDSENHWHECMSCGYKAIVVAHKFDNTCDTICNVCENVREITHTYGDEWLYDEEGHWQKCAVCEHETDKAEHNVEDGVCTVCGADCYTVGDIDGEEGVTANDAIYLLYSVFFGEETYPIDQPCDFDGDGGVTANDAIYLLYHVFFGDELYPLN